MSTSDLAIARHNINYFIAMLKEKSVTDLKQETCKIYTRINCDEKDDKLTY